MNENIVNINNIKTPYVIYNNDKYYPCRYIFEKILLKGVKNVNNDDKLKDFIVHTDVDWSFKNGGIQKCYCMNKDGWRVYLTNTKINARKTDKKIHGYNSLCEYFGFYDLIHIDNFEEYDDYEKDLLKNFKHNKKESNKCKNFKCIKCGKELPLHEYFFKIDKRLENSLTKVCRKCDCKEHSGFGYINPYDKIGRNIYNKFGINEYKLYKTNEIEFINTHDISKFDFTYKTSKEVVYNLVKKDYKNGFIDNDNMCIDYVKNKYRFLIKGLNITNNELIEYVTDNKCILKPYKFKKYKNMIGEDYYKNKQILKNYINDNNIKIDDCLTYDKYCDIIIKSRIKVNDFLKFIVYFNDYKYAGYMFKFKSNNYYKDKDNRIFDMKYFIEKDRKIDINKIPLYLTKYCLSKFARPMYCYINKRNISLFEWVNECYPDKYNINDFEINPYRSGFDSLEEAQVDDILKQYISKGVYYNQRNTDYEIEIDGMIPDWILITNKGCYLVEYFGLYQEDNHNSARIVKYKEKMSIKNKKYKELEKKGYKTLFIYPDDIRNGFEKLIEKLNKII